MKRELLLLKYKESQEIITKKFVHQQIRQPGRNEEISINIQFSKTEL